MPDQKILPFPASEGRPIPRGIALPVGSNPRDQHEPIQMVHFGSPKPIGVYRLESDGTRYEITVTDDPWVEDQVRVMWDTTGGGNGRWCTMRRDGVISSTYVDEKLQPRSEIDLFHLTRLIAYALGRDPHQAMPLEEVVGVL